MAWHRKHWITALKISISLTLVYFIFTKIDLGVVLRTLQKSKPLPLVLALVLFVASKILSAYRLNLYFHQLKVRLTQNSNLKLYLLGMFYNLFLPGGIGGDAYKGYLIKRQFGVNTKRVVAVLLLDRLSGLLLLWVYACSLALLLPQSELSMFKATIAVLGFMSALIFWRSNKKYFGEVYPVFWGSIGYAALVQLAQLASAYFILMALNVEENQLSYLFIFLISSIVSVLPLTIGGIGSREVTFFYGAKLLGLDENTSVGISMEFFIITALVSLFGILYHFKKPELQVYENH
ncbi:MAG: lysylphosphatidylglycerol synthase transmembrane domain-containing protein [Flavobacteriaceae bacterium]